MNRIFEKIKEETGEGRDLVLVTIISQQGSSPRGLGAQMLVGAEGRLLGTVGGGAVELHCIQYSKVLLQEKRSCERAYDLTPKKEENIGMVCGGDVTVWLQFIDASLPFWPDFSEKLLQRLKDRQEGWLLFHLDGELPELTDEEERGGQTENQVFIPLQVRERAVIFGGGHCAQALAPILNTVGFQVTVMDNRRELSRPELFPGAEEVICGDYMRISDYIRLLESDYVVIMTNGHSHDFEVERQVLENPPVYVGAIGSKSKKAFVNQKLRESGVPEDIIEKVHCPIGTAIRAVTPEEIAISIAGEMILERAMQRGDGEKCGCPMH